MTVCPGSVTPMIKMIEDGFTLKEVAEKLCPRVQNKEEKVIRDVIELYRSKGKDGVAFLNKHLKTLKTTPVSLKKLHIRKPPQPISATAIRVITNVFTNEDVIFQEPGFAWKLSIDGDSTIITMGFSEDNIQFLNRQRIEVERVDMLRQTKKIKVEGIQIKQREPRCIQFESKTVYSADLFIKKYLAPYLKTLGYTIEHPQHLEIREVKGYNKPTDPY